MSTAFDIISMAFQALGVYAPNEQIDGDDMKTALSVLNAMLDTWSNENLLSYAIMQYNLPLVINKQQYTIGLSSSADLNQLRPLKLIAQAGGAYVTDLSNNRYPVQVITQEQWNQIGLLSTTSQIPTMIFYDPQFPLGVLNVFPLPSLTYTLTFSAYMQFSSFTDMTQTVNLPPGYFEAIYSNLAVRLHTFFKDAQLRPELVQYANSTRASVKRTNMRSIPAQFDPYIVSRATPTYNIFRDANNGS